MTNMELERSSIEECWLLEIQLYKHHARRNKLLWAIFADRLVSKCCFEVGYKKGERKGFELSSDKSLYYYIDKIKKTRLSNQTKLIGIFPSDIIDILGKKISKRKEGNKRLFMYFFKSNKNHYASWIQK